MDMAPRHCLARRLWPWPYGEGLTQLRGKARAHLADLPWHREAGSSRRDRHGTFFDTPRTKPPVSEAQEEMYLGVQMLETHTLVPGTKNALRASPTRRVPACGPFMASIVPLTFCNNSGLV